MTNLQIMNPLEKKKYWARSYMYFYDFIHFIPEPAQKYGENNLKG